MSASDFRACARGHFTKSGKPLRVKLLKQMLADHDDVSEKWTDLKMTIAKIQHIESAFTLEKDKRVKVQVPMFTYQSEDWFLDELALEEGQEAWEAERAQRQVHCDVTWPEESPLWLRPNKFVKKRRSRVLL